MMSKLLLSILFSFLLLHANAQDAVPLESKIPKDSLAYMRYPEMPSFNILLTDSTTIFNTYNIPKGAPVLLVLFDPDCKHCRLLTKRLMDGMDSLKEIQMYWVTHVHSMAAIRKYSEEHHFADHKNIKVVGRDYEFFMSPYYGITIVPDLALYDANKNIIKLFEGGTTVSDLYEALHQKK